MSLLSSIVHSAPLFGSTSGLAPEDLPPLPDTASTVSSSRSSIDTAPTLSSGSGSFSLSIRTTPLSRSASACSPIAMMDMEHDAAAPATVPTPAAAAFNPDETHLIVSDPEEDVFVEARETLTGQDDTLDVEMYDGEETENEKARHGGLGDVNQMTSAFQTPDRKRTFEVDSKTITRPKKTSPLSVPLPEVFNQENNGSSQQEESLPAAPPRPIAASTPIAMSATAAATSSTSTISPRPSAAAAAAGTPVSSAAAPPPSGLGDTVTKRPAAPPASSAARSARQQTMVVSSALTKDLRAAIEHEKTSGLDEAAATRLEARILALVQEKEREWAAKHDKLGQIMVAQKGEADTRARQADADREGLTAALEALNAANEGGFPCSRCAGGVGGGPSSSLPHLPPAPVLAAMSADKMAELARLKKEKESLESENNKLHTQYNSLYETYSQQRTVIPQLKTANDELEQGIKRERERFEKLKRHAEAKLEDAGAENDNLRGELTRQQKAHTDDTLTMRIRLKQREGEIEELQQTVAQKRRQVADLKEMCEQLIKQADANASDIE